MIIPYKRELDELLNHRLCNSPMVPSIIIIEVYNINNRDFNLGFFNGSGYTWILTINHILLN